MPMRTALALAALVVGASCGTVDAEAPKACVTAAGERVEGVPVPVKGGYNFEFEYKFSKGLLPTNGEYEVKLLSVSLEGKAGADFGFVDTADLTGLDPSNPEAAGTQLLHYSKTKPPGATLALDTSASPVDVTKFVRERTVLFGLKLQGMLPQKSFDMDVVACFSLKATSDYSL